MPSNIAGYLDPDATPAPPVDDPFEDFIHDVLVGLSGIADELVRPRFQGEPPTQPGRTVDWVSFGLAATQADTYAANVHINADAENPEGADTFQRHETVNILVSCYGPNAQGYATLIRDSLQVEQNRAVLTANGVGLQETTEIINAPVLAKEKWLRRYDFTIIVRRCIDREYGVLSILSVDLFLKAPTSIPT